MKYCWRWWLSMCILCIFNINRWYGYFEHIYQCTLSGSSIHITLQAQDRSYNCMHVVNFLYEKEQGYKQQIDTLTDYDQTQDQDYRSDISQTLHANLEQSSKLRQAIISKVQLFESQLFVSVKKVILYKLGPEFSKLHTHKNDIQYTIKTSVQQGKIQNLPSMQAQYQKYVTKLALWQGIQSTNDFATLMAYLQLYKEFSE